MDVTLASLYKEISDLKEEVKKLQQRFSWEEKETETGIKIAGGPTTITRTGTYLGTTSIPTPQGIAVVMILKEDHTGRLAMLSPELLKPL
jgi:hypothetical protein